MLRLIAAALWIAGTGTLAAWIVSRVLTDTVEWSQFLYWIPSRLSLIASAGALAGALAVYVGWRVLRRVTTELAASGATHAGHGGSRAGVRGRLAMGLLWGSSLVWVACLGYAGVVEWRWHALPGNVAMIERPRLRVAFWNLGGGERTGWVELARAREADLMILCSPSGSLTRREFGELADARTAVYPMARFLVASRLRMVERGSLTLGIEAGIGIDPRSPGGLRTMNDPGMAVYMVFEDPLRPLEPGARLVVWIIDLPSDPSLHRMAVTRSAREAIDTWRGPVQRRLDESMQVLEERPNEDETAVAARRLRLQGTWVTIHPDDRAGAGLAEAGFPEPDVIVGDFNIPRGSASLRVLTGDLRNVFDMAGAGGMETFPRTVDYLGIDRAWLRRAVELAGVPLVHIDQMFVREPIRAVRYEVLDLGMCSHLMQVCDFER